MGYVVKAVYPNGGHVLTDNKGRRMYYQTKEEADKAAKLVVGVSNVIVVQSSN